MSQPETKRMALWKKVGLASLSLVLGSYVLGAFLHREIHTEITIDASPQVVWQHLVDFERYPEWNPFIREISGELEVGERLSATITPPGGEPMSFSPRVVVSDENRELRWLGTLGLPRLFDGEHSFAIEDAGGGTVRFVQGETFTGLLAVLAWGSVEPGTTRGFVEMNEALKARAEAHH